jgi:hypothetical protein
MESQTEAQSGPQMGVRLILWFGIYLAAQVPMICRLGDAYNPLNVFLFPMSLGMVVAIPLNMMPGSVSQIVAFALLPLGFIAGYIIYPLHLMATLRARDRRRFSFLLLELAAMVLMNQAIQWSMMNAITG